VPFDIDEVYWHSTGRHKLLCMELQHLVKEIGQLEIVHTRIGLIFAGLATFLAQGPPSLEGGVSGNTPLPPPSSQQS